MLDFLRKNFIYLFFGFVLIFIFITFILSGGLNSKTPTPQTSSLDNRPKPGASYQTSTQENIQFREHSAKVAQLIKLLPYQGQNFYLNYFYYNNSYILNLRKNQTKAGLDEFDQFLKQNEIEDRSWIRNLVIVENQF